MNETAARKQELEQILLEFVARIAKDRNATPSELQALSEVAHVLAGSLSC